MEFSEKQRKQADALAFALGIPIAIAIDGRLFQWRPGMDAVEIFRPGEKAMQGTAHGLGAIPGKTIDQP